MKRTLSALLVTILLLTGIPFNVQALSNAETIFAFLKNDIGFNSAAACGVLANIEKESSFNPNASGDNGASYGICQWNTFRFTALRNWCESNGYDYTTLDGQLHYLQFELSANNSNYLWNGKTIYNKLIAVTDTAEGAYAAAYDWCYYFEVPANKEKRAIERGNLAVSTYWPSYGEGDPSPTVVDTQLCNYAITIGTNAGDILLYDHPTINVESERRLENQAEPFTIHCSEKLLLSNNAIRYYFYSESEGRGYYLSWNPYLMTLQQTHTWSDWVMANQPTCRKTGLEKRVCACGAEETRSIRKLAHTYKKVTTTASLTKDGKIRNVCTECGYTSSKVTTICKTSSVKLSKTSYTYNGKVQKPSVVVKDSNGKTISSKHYTVTYSSGCKNAGTYKVTVKFKGNYSGTKTLTYKINPISVSKCEIALSKTSYTYDGKSKIPSVIVLNHKGTKLTDSSFTVTYASGRKNVGKYKVTIKMKGNYSGTKTLYFTINPAKTTVKSLTAGSKKLTVNITKKSTQVTGYQIQYSTSKSFKSYKTKTVSSYKTTKTTLTGLKAKKTYYVRIRTYKTVNGTKYYSGWSTIKYKKTK